MTYYGEKKNAYYRERNQRLRLQWIAENGPCESCGSWDHLEVHHENPRKETGEPQINWDSKASREKYLADCIVLCHDCHRVVTSVQMALWANLRAEKRKEPPHGSLKKFRHGCRCKKCKGAWQEFQNLRKRGPAV